MPVDGSAVLNSCLSAARAGSNEALGRVLELCRPDLLAFARQSLGAALRKKGGASDLVQDTFLEAQRQFARFEGASTAQLLAWLRALLRHKAAHVGRRFHGTSKRQLSREIPLDQSAFGCVRPSEIAAHSPSPSVQVMADEQVGHLRLAIERLPQDQRRVMQSRYERGQSFEEIAREMGRTPDAARMLWARGVERLKREMHDDGTPR